MLHLYFENEDVKKQNPVSYHLQIGQTTDGLPDRSSTCQACL